MRVEMGETLWRHVRRIHDENQIRSMTDGELVACFAESGDRDAFEELFRRCAPLVWGVCVRTLGATPEAEDAFQAVFLLLVQNVRKIRDRSRISSWLYGTARKVASRAARRRTKRDRRERSNHPYREPECEDAAPRDWEPLLEAALGRMPPKYREVLLLCELQQKSRAEAAQILNLSENSLSSRLARAKEMLRARLARTGVALPAGLVPLTVVPPALQSAALQLALRLADHAGPPAQVIPSTLIPLIHGGSKLMFVAKSFACLALGVLVTLGLTSPEAVPQGKVENPPVAKPTPEPVVGKAEPPKADPAKGKKPPSDLDRMQGEWVVKKFVRFFGRGARNTLFDGPEPAELFIHDKEIWLGASGPCPIGTLELDESFTPRRINTSFPLSEDSGTMVTARGTYAFAPDGQLTLAFGLNPATIRPSPEDVPKEEDSSRLWIVLVRPPEPKAPLPEGVKELLGEWEVTSCLLNGGGSGAFLSLTFLRDRLLFETVDGRRKCERTNYSLDATHEPKGILWWNPAFQPEAFGKPGIYSIDGDTLTIATGVGSGEGIRPRAFESREGDGVLFLKAKRKSKVSTPPASESDSKATPPPEGITTGTAPVAIEWQGHKIDIPFRVSDNVRSEDVVRVNLWVSYDGGKVYEHAVVQERQIRESVVLGEPIKSGDFPFTAIRSGVVLFAIQTIDRNGTAYPAEKELKPQLKVRFIPPNPNPEQVPTLRASGPPQNLPESDRLKQENDDLRKKLDGVLKRLDELERSAKGKK